MRYGLRLVGHARNTSRRAGKLKEMTVSNNGSTALALTSQQNSTGMSLDETLTLGKVLAGSGYFQDARDVGQAVAKILAGRELGIGPLASMTGIYIVKGRVTLSANLIAAQIKRSGRYDYRVKRLDNEGCEVEFYQNNEPIGTSTFTKEDARVAGLGGDNWTKFPKNMLYARAISNGAKFYCPDVFSGPVYTPDEMGARVDEQGEIIDVTPTEPVQVADTVAATDPERDQAIDRFRNEAKRLKLGRKDGQRFVYKHFGTEDSTSLETHQIAFLADELSSFADKEAFDAWMTAPPPEDDPEF